MSHIRLIGLLLFITAITLALAAAATRTTHVEVNSQWIVRTVQHGGNQFLPTGPESSTTIPAGGSTPASHTEVQPLPSSEPPHSEAAHRHDWDYSAHRSQFNSTAIPIAWPLLATGGTGLLLWFIQVPTELRHSPKKRSGHRKRRR